MQIQLTKWAPAVLFLASAFAQSADRTFYLTKPGTPRDLDSMATMVRTVADVQRITLDQERSAMVASGTLDQMMLTEWLFQNAAQPVPAGQPATPEYRMAGPNGDVVRVYRMPPTATPANLTALITSIRTIVDVQRLFPFESQRAIVARGALDRMDAVTWMVNQLIDPDAPKVSPDYHLPPRPQGDEVARIYRLDAGTTSQALAELSTALRTIADIQRLFPYESAPAIIMCANPAKVAAADWVIHQLSDPPAAAPYQIPDVADGSVRVVHLAHRDSASDLTGLTTQLRTTLRLQRLFPLASRHAMALRGTPDQIAEAEVLIAHFDQE